MRSYWGSDNGMSGGHTPGYSSFLSAGVICRELLLVGMARGIAGALAIDFGGSGGEKELNWFRKPDPVQLERWLQTVLAPKIARCSGMREMPFVYTGE